MMFRIGMFSRICQVPVSALRYYAEIGLLEPAQIDPSSGYRYYAATQLPRLNRILALKDMGLSLEEIGAILDEGIDAGQLRGMLRLKRAEIGQRVTEEQTRLDMVEARLRLIEKEGTMPDAEIVLKQAQSLQGLAIRDVLPKVEDIGDLIGDGFAGLEMGGLNLVGPPMAIYHDPEFTGTEVDVEMVYPVADTSTPLPTPAGRTLEKRVVEGCQVASIIHAAPFETISETYQSLAAWIEEHGYRFAGPPQEIYLSDPNQPGPPVAEIRIPVEED
jgi:DNA-binding transcriptional MerR regulator